MATLNAKNIAFTVIQGVTAVFTALPSAWWRRANVRKIRRADTSLL
jgi:hypothetical protein